MIWALMLFLSSESIMYIDFSSKELCEQTRQELIHQRWVAGPKYAICIPRGTFQ